MQIDVKHEQEVLNERDSNQEEGHRSVGRPKSNLQSAKSTKQKGRSSKKLHEIEDEESKKVVERQHTESKRSVREHS